MSRKIKEVLTLECFLSIDEKLRYSERLSNYLSDKEREEDSLKALKSQAKSKIDEIDAGIREISDKIRTGKESREIGCEIIYNFEKGIKSWVRTDTGEFVKDDVITARELQENINLNQTEEESVVEVPEVIEIEYKEVKDDVENINLNQMENLKQNS